MCLRVCLAIQASTGRPYDPRLKLNGESIPFIGKNTFSFLGAPVSVHGADKSRSNLLSKLSVLLEKVDKTLLSARQKLLLFKVAICPRLTWDLSVNHFPVSWLESTLQPIATIFLKRWSGLAKSADTGLIFGDTVQEAASCQRRCIHLLPGPSHQSDCHTRDQEGSHSDQICFQAIPGRCCGHAGGPRGNIQANAQASQVQSGGRGHRCPSSPQHQSVQAEPATPG